MTVDWRIYYGDGSMFTSDDGGPSAAPGRNVQVIVCQNDPNVDGWNGRDLSGLYDYLGEPGWKVVKQGRTVRDALFSDLVGRASDDTDVPGPRMLLHGFDWYTFGPHAALDWGDAS